MINLILKYVTPLRVVGVVFLVMTIVFSIQIGRQLNQGYEPGLGGLFPLGTVAVSISAFLIDFFLSMIFKTKRKVNFLTQLTVVTICLAWIYWPQWILNIEVPNSLNGELIIVYELDSGEKLPLGLWGTGDKLKVPANGIVFTSSDFLSNHRNTVCFDDSGIDWAVHGDYRSKFDLPPLEDTVYIENKGYLFQVIPIRTESNVNYKELESRLDSMKMHILIAHKKVANKR